MNKAALRKRLIIGSANFEQTYGADPTKVNYDEVKKILYLAKKNNILKIDTAEDYLKKKNVFKNINKKFIFFTKIVFDSRSASLEFCEKYLENHFKIFNTNKVETIYFHDIKILFSKDGKKIFKNLEVLKKKKYFQKIGFSIYDPDCLNYIIPNYNFDAVQFPFNLLDRRIVTSGWYDKLKNLKIETHIRSVFLQGLLVNKLVIKKKYFKKWQQKIFGWFQYLENKNISPIDYCLTDLLTYDYDKIIIGINNYNNLNEIINFKKIKKNIKVFNFNINDTKLIDPRKWK